MFAFDSKQYSKRLLQLISWSHWFTFFNIAMAILLSSFYFFNEPSPDSLIGHVYLLTTWLSHMAFLTFISFVLIVFPIILLLPNPRFIRAMASLVFTIGLFLLVLDAFIYAQLGYHLNASSYSQIIALIASEAKENNPLFSLVSVIIFILILTFELVVSNYAWKHLTQLQKTVFARPIVFTLVSAFFFSHITHIWADTSLDYDILRQDTVLPLSYPLTAKTLLTKYEMFNQDDYIKRKTSSLSFTAAIPTYPVLSQSCQGSKLLDRAVFIVLSEDLLTKEQQQQFANRASVTSLKLNHHIDSALHQDAWFNLFYSLPTIYQTNILDQAVPPILFQAIAQKNLATSLTFVNNNTTQGQQASWFDNLFNEKVILNDIRELTFPDKLNNFAPGIHIIAFAKNNQYQFELFTGALLLAQKQKADKDLIWISSIGNDSYLTSLSTKPALLIWPDGKDKTINMLSSHMDLQSTLVKHWLGCNIDHTDYSNGADLLTLRHNRIIANTVDKGIMVFNKDKSVLIDQNGNFQSYSRQLSAPIVEKSNFPLMIDGVHYIKQFSQKDKN